LRLKQVTVTEALEVIYNALDLASTDIGSILFISQKEKIKKGNIQTKTVEVQNIGFSDAKSLVENLVTAVNEGPETNCLVLVGTDQEIKKALKILEEVDVPQPQVVLEAKIIEINEDALQEIGVDWPDSITLSAQESKRPESLEGIVDPGTPPFRVHPFARTAIQFDLIIKMLESENKAKLLSSPRITTVNNKEAEIFIGDKIPYEITTNNDGAVTTEVRFVEPGIRLKITPSIVEKDFVVIKVEPEVSFIYSFRGANDQYPWVKSREATAYVRVRNGQPFVIGGLLNAEDKKSLYSVPFLGKIPLLGNLFSYSKDEQNKTDLVITVTPTVITDTL
jgi:type II secretory pathway component GspD/PulD (secretin)